MMRESNDNEQISRHQMLAQEHDMFSSELQSRQPEFDEVEHVLKRHITPPAAKTPPTLPTLEESTLSGSRQSLTSTPTKKLAGSKLKLLGRHR
jgi:hypothetical protein